MPSTRLDKNSLPIRTYDVVGESKKSQKYFVYHVGLSREEISIIGEGFSCGVVHMRPPFKTQDQILPDVHGTARLSVDEIQMVKIFINERDSEYKAACLRDENDQYHFHPAILPLASSDGTIIYYRYSCAGFVLAGYRDADIDFLDDSDLPLIGLAKVQEFYSFLADPDKRERFGPRGEGPWPILLCGYLFHALDRDSEEIRALAFRPKAGDEFFPRV